MVVVVVVLAKRKEPNRERGGKVLRRWLPVGYPGCVYKNQWWISPPVLVIAPGSSSSSSSSLTCSIIIGFKAGRGVRLVVEFLVFRRIGVEWKKRVARVAGEGRVDTKAAGTGR
ncbi:hypothetical protein K0M31_012174 [Melipona bicolor]|uniref:Uncharacterized protein n=1 Tax=Melipona bicolor TaxID=60889 RepID=A0AA40FK19_9HYME|nr:hypothetical protein K0M31_012174 [Melipona bicolor]